jgi:flavin-dependent dehydrogenase
MELEADAVVAGGGPAGAASALLLAQRGYQIILVDKCAFPRDKPCAEYLSPEVAPVLDRLGVLAAVEATMPAHLKGFLVYTPRGRVFRGDFAGVRDRDGRVIHETGLALPRIVLDTILLAAARRAGVTILEQTRVTQFTPPSPAGAAPVGASCACDHTGGRMAAGVLTATQRGADLTLRAPLVVAADGLHSTIARRLGLHRPSRRLRRIALVTHMRGIRDLTPYGEMHVGYGRYVGLAPLEPASQGDLTNVALVIDESEGRRIAGHVEAFFDEALRTFPRLVGRLATARRVKPILTVSRLAVHARRLVADGVMLVGDAAGFYDPFTGEGIYRALRGAELLAEVAAAALAAGDCLAARLAAYERHYQREFAGKRVVEWIVQEAIARPWLFQRIAGQLAQRQSMADTLMGVTGDFLSPSAVLRPGYLLRLLI